MTLLARHALVLLTALATIGLTAPAAAASPSNPDVVYIGMREVDLRGDVSPGDGVYKTVDGGRTWRHIGLTDTQMIGNIRVDPDNCDAVFVAALGHAFGPNAERGVFRS